MRHLTHTIQKTLYGRMEREASNELVKNDNYLKYYSDDMYKKQISSFYSHTLIWFTFNNTITYYSNEKNNI